MFISVRIGEWLPQIVIDAWLTRHITKVNAPPTTSYSDLHPVIQEFQKLIEQDAEIFMSFHQMFEQVPSKPPYNNDPTGKPQVRDYMTMLRLFDEIIRNGPKFENLEADFLGFPINAILNWPMGTPAGVSTFTNPKVNAQIRKMLNVWASFLASPASCHVLTTADDGWFGPAASVAMPNFSETFICNTSAPYHGFKSWDDFFTRAFRPGMRPVGSPDNDAIITSACESTVYRIASDVKARDSFWIKGEPYSLHHMLNNDALAPQFIGGTIYQAFLSALNYHRWHSPVSGTIRRTVMVLGTHYAESPAMGFPNPDPAACTLSQGFITAVATRALIFIQADNPNIGLMCFIAVGMAEVSTCDITVRAGQRIKKGDEIGMFHFGGSTHCLVFRPETKITFGPDCAAGASVLLNAAIATVAS